MASWDDEDFVPIVVPAKGNPDKWDGEDEEDENVKDNWDEEEDPSKETTETKQAAPKKKKTVAQKIKEKEERMKLEKQERANRVKEDEENEEDESLLDDVEEKLRRQKLVEAADFENVKETFGVSVEALPGQKTIDNFQPTNKEEFNEFSKMLVEKLKKFETHREYVSFLEGLFRDCCAGVEAEDIKNISSTLNILAGEKLKAMKAVTAKGKKKSSKKTLTGASMKASRKDDFDDFGDYRDDLDEFDDFM